MNREDERNRWGTCVKIYARPMDGAGVRKTCNVGHHRFIESGVAFGHNVTSRSGNMLWEGTRFRTVYLSDLRSWPQELESENARLEKPLAEEELVDIDLLKGVNRETSEPGPEKESCGASAASFEASERRACWVVGQPRSSQRYVSMKVGNRIEPSKPQYSPE